MQDPELLVEVERAKTEFDPLPGAELHQLVLKTLNVSPKVGTRVRDLLQAVK
jgi:hypothetical protein